MAFYDKGELKNLYKTSKDEAHIWREDYPAYERLADNDLMEGLDPNLPEVNDGSLAAALFKLPKRIVSSKLSGTVKAIDRDEAWMSELANIVWQRDIIPNANTQAPFHRKWKDAVRKAAIYGSVPLITIFVEKDGKRHADFIVAQPQDVILEAGKVSDYDSDVMFWDVYYSELQLKNMIEMAREDQKANKDSDSDSYNKWDIPALTEILNSKDEEQRSSLDSPRQEDGKNVRPKGFKFCVAVQRGVDAPFRMYHPGTNKTVREWGNPDPTGDVNIHFLYCYQDFINPYGTGIVKLAGGTQNVLDYMRQADVLATQLGLRPPLKVKGAAEDVDLESIVYAQDAFWFVGQNADVERQELADGVYNQLPGRMSMYQASLQKLIPTGDTSISGTDSGDPNMSKTPAGVKLAAANLSIDDEDFKDNLYMTYEAVARSMINTHFANMEGTDMLKVSDDEREILMKAGLTFEPNEMGEFSNQVEIAWDAARASFEFEVDPEQDKTKDDQEKLDGLTRVAELVATDPTLEQDLKSAGKKLNRGELYSEIIKLTTDNDKIITDISPEEEQMEGVDQQTGQPTQPDPQQALLGQKMQQQDESHQMNMASKQQEMQMRQEKHDAAMAAKAPQPAQLPSPAPEEMQANVEAVMQEFGVDEQTAITALAAEHEGLPIEDIIAKLQEVSQQ